ncbi:DNA polymerase IV [Rothia kristinae]|uniref:DNA polymerase IV n=1 Tax=Rothia kristinae TaxID=37923 RepID=UPI000A42A133|nr:DNA polymerase IV [Rothia kristinae]
MPAVDSTDFPHRVILHVDMDAFFVGVELLTRPELVGRQVVVAGSGSRSVVLSASYEARALGVHSAMPVARARRLAPRAVYIEPSHSSYSAYSRQIMAVLHEVTDLVEQVSVDEAFLDVTGAQRRLGSPVRIARGIRTRILQRTGLVASIGVASNKFIAKMASTGSKPDGLWVVPEVRIGQFLDPLPVGRLWGVGEKTAANLQEAGLHTVGQLREMSLEYLQRRLGRASGAHLWELARGIDERPVQPRRVEKSMGGEHTFAADTDDVVEIKAALLQLSHDVARRLRASGRTAAAVSLKLRDQDFRTLTRTRTLERAAGTGREINTAAVRLFDELGPLAGRVRLVGVRAERLEEDAAGRQLSLWEEADGDRLRAEAEWGGAESAMDRIRERFGPAGLRPARLVSGGFARRYRPEAGAGAQDGAGARPDPRGPGENPREKG